MRIKTLDFASGRTKDGRQFAAGEGAILDADEADRDKVDLFRHFVAVGLAEIIEPKPEPAKSESRARKTATAKDGDQ